MCLFCNEKLEKNYISQKLESVLQCQNMFAALRLTCIEFPNYEDFPSVCTHFHYCRKRHPVNPLSLTTVSCRKKRHKIFGGKCNQICSVQHTINDIYNLHSYDIKKCFVVVFFPFVLLPINQLQY